MSLCLAELLQEWRLEEGEDGLEAGSLLMPRPHQDVNRMLGLEHKAVIECDAHAGTYPVARLKAASAVRDHPLSKHEKREVVGSVNLCELFRS